MNVCKRFLAVILSVVIIFAALPISNVVFAEEINTARIFEDNFDDESSLENYEAAVNNAYGGTALNAKDVAPAVETVDERSVFKAHKGSTNNQQAAELVKYSPEGRRIESVTTTFKQLQETSNEDAYSGVVAYHSNSRNSLVLCIYPYNHATNTTNNDYICYSWCRFSYAATGSSSSVKNNTIEISTDQVTNVKKWRYSTGLVGDNTSWLTVTLNYDYSQIKDGILTVSATITDAEGNTGTIPSYSAKFDDTVYNCTDADGNILESGQYMKYDENFKVGTSSFYGAYNCYYDNFKVQYSKTTEEFAADFRTEYSDELSYTKITTREQFDAVAKAKLYLESAQDEVQELLAGEKAKLCAALETYTVFGDDFELENYSNEIWETVPYSGDIRSWSASTSAFASTTDSTLTAASKLVTDTLDSENTVFAPEIRSQQRKVKLQTVKDEYIKEGSMINSLSIDFRIDANYNWDTNSGFYYYYKNPYNWGRIEFTLTSDGLVNTRLMQNKGNDDGTEMVATTILGNCPLSNTAIGSWINIKVDYEYLTDGTNLTFTYTDKATDTVPYTRTFKTTDFNVGGKVGIASASTDRSTIYYDNFGISYTTTANDFREGNARVLALGSSTVQISDLADVNAAITDYEALHYEVKGELSDEYALLKALKAKIIRMQKQDTVYISSSGNDNNNGTSGNPTATFDAAVALMNKGGAIYIDGEYVVDSKFAFKSYGKDLVITGGTLDLSALSNVNFADNITFDNVTLKFKDNANIYANGYKLTINENVTVEGTSNLYGGGASGTTVDSTSLKILSGNYKAIYGGSNQGTVLGDTNLYIGGYVNKDIVTALAHANTTNIYGGGLNDTVGGNANIIFTDNALSSYVSGGGTSGTVGGNVNIEVSGNAQSYGVYGGSKAAGTVGGDINVLINGGAVADLFGGHGGANHEGNVYIELKKGSVDRRLWGGCYNENSGLSWATSYHVVGNIYVTVWSGFTFVFDGKDSLNSSYNDLSFYAHSRCKNQSDEISNIIYIDSNAYNSLKSKEKYHDTDFSSSIFMSMAAPSNAADNIYYCSYSANDNTITKTYNKVSGSNLAAGTATIGVDENVSLEYTGKAIEAAKITYNSNWFAHKLDIAYSNNVEVGTATAAISTNGVTASTTFDIYYDTTPSILGASIKKSLTQDIQFTARLPKNSKKVAEYGMAVTFYNNIGNGVELSEMTADSLNQKVDVAKKVLSTPVVMSQETFTLNVGKIDASYYGYRFVVRAFVRYEGESTYYYSDDNTGSLSGTSGVENGYASRSVISISKSILSWVYENQDVLHGEYGVADVNAIIKKNETTGKYSWVSGITANNGEKVLAYLNNNADAISEAINDIR